MKNRKVTAIIFAGGTGVRMGTELPKQFLEVEDKPIMIHTLDIFENSPLVDEIYIACKEDFIDMLKELIERFKISKVKGIVPGGTSALGSQYNGLAEAAKHNPDDAIVLIHDGVRPCINDELIEKVVKLTEEKGAVATCTPMFETPVVSKGGEIVEETPLRADCYTAQAPQAFRLGELLKAHEEVRAENPEYKGLVDSCSLLRSIGKDVAILKGPRSNIKVTTPEDLYIFKAMLQYERDRANSENH